MQQPIFLCNAAGLLWLTAAAVAQNAQPEQRTVAPDSGQISTVSTEPDLNVQIVDALNKRYGEHPGYRSNHAKGIVVEGSFLPTPAAAALSRSPVFAGAAALPVTVRFSDAGGIPNVSDASPLANPHGMAIKFHLPSGEDSDIVSVAFKFFPVATPEDFRDLQLAAATSPPGAPRSAQFQAFLESHPSVEKAGATLGVPASFADEQYFGVDAFVFINQAGARQAFRYIIAPEKIVHLSKEASAAQQPSYLMDDLPKRLARGPVTFHLKAQLAAPGDQTKDPTQAWPDDRPVVDLGTLTISKAASDSDSLQSNLLFTPGRLTDGIEPSDDPLIAARDGSYAVSLQRRNPALASAEFTRALTESMARADREMTTASLTGDPDHDFAAMIIPNYEAAIGMARVYLRYGRDSDLRRWAQEIVASQGPEADAIRRRWAAGP